jgi:hypothetical protein
MPAGTDRETPAFLPIRAVAAGENGGFPGLPTQVRGIPVSMILFHQIVIFGP